MGFTPYHTHVLLPQDVDLENLPKRLAVQLAPHGVRLESGLGLPHLLFESYAFFLSRDSQETGDVAQSNTEILKAVGTPEEQVREYPFLLTYGGVDLDPDMSHFNDALFLQEAIEILIPDAIFYDPQSGERL